MIEDDDIDHILTEGIHKAPKLSDIKICITPKTLMESGILTEEEREKIVQAFEEEGKMEKAVMYADGCCAGCEGKGFYAQIIGDDTYKIVCTACKGTGKMVNKKIEWALSALKESCKGKACKYPALKTLEKEILKLEKKNNDLKRELGSIRQHIRQNAEHFGVENIDSLSPYQQLNQIISYWQTAYHKQVVEIEAYEKKFTEIRNELEQVDGTVCFVITRPVGKLLNIVKIGNGGGSK